jgi:hypothetical protein
MRHDGTRSYFFEIEEFRKLAIEANFEVLSIEYCLRDTTNKKEGLFAQRIFLQAVLQKIQ